MFPTNSLVAIGSNSVGRGAGRAGRRFNRCAGAGTGGHTTTYFALRLRVTLYLLNTKKLRPNTSKLWRNAKRIWLCPRSIILILLRILILPIRSTITITIGAYYR